MLSLRRLVIAPLLVGIASVTLASSAAGAQERDTTVAVDDVELVTDADGVSTLAATLTVSGTNELTVVSIVATDLPPDLCTPMSQPILHPGVATPIKIKLPGTCKLADPASIEFATYPISAVQPVDSNTTISPNAKPPSSPPFGNLWGFGLGAVAAIAVTSFAWWLGPNLRGHYPGDPAWPLGVRDGLPGLNGKWTWESSQLTSVTVVAALFTGLLGSTSVLEKILGDDGDDSIAVVVVASAFAAVLVAAAPFILAVLRKEPESYKTTEAPNNYRTIGVLVATIIVETASVGLILSIARTLSQGTNIPMATVWAGGLITVPLALAYGARSMRRTLKIGMVESKAEAALRIATQAASLARKKKESLAFDRAKAAMERADIVIEEARSILKEPAPDLTSALSLIDDAKSAYEGTRAKITDPSSFETPLAEELKSAIAEVAKAAEAARTARAAEPTSDRSQPTISAARARQVYQEAALP